MQVLSVYISNALSKYRRGKLQYSTASSKARVSVSKLNCGEIP